MGDGGFPEIPRPPFPKTECRKGLDRYEKIIWVFEAICRAGAAGDLCADHPGLLRSFPAVLYV